jgi:hypothetical protein
MTGEAAPRTGIRLTVADLRLRSLALARKLRSLKAQTTLPEGPWYPYDIFGNLKRLWRLLGPCFDLGPFVAEGVYDIGTADGDMALLLDSFGVQVAAIDNPSTNCNRMAGVRRLCAAQNARVSVHEFDIDSCLPLPCGRRSLALFLGTLYHLKNPLGALERIRESCDHCILSTRIAQATTDGRLQFGDQPVAYLLGHDECNHDATNYWILSHGGLLRLASRAGWTVLRSLRHGATRGSDPAANDERAYLLLRRT